MAATIKLAEIAPRIANAQDQQVAENMRGIKRCSCGCGWRIIGHEYDYGGCFERLERAQGVRDRLPEYRLAAPEQKSEAACDGHEFDYRDLRPSERLRYEEEAAEIAAGLYGQAALPASYRRMVRAR